MLLPLSLPFGEAVLILNGLWMMHRLAEREIVVINFAVAAITGTVAGLGMIGAEGVAAVKGAALTLLFHVTCLWVRVNRMRRSEGRGLGWFSLFVALSLLVAGPRCMGCSNWLH